jgi:hypothetical protein
MATSMVQTRSGRALLHLGVPVLVLRIWSKLRSLVLPDSFERPYTGMKTERWGNGGAVEIQRLTASKLLPQLTQVNSALSEKITVPPESRTFRRVRIE